MLKGIFIRGRQHFELRIWKLPGFELSFDNLFGMVVFSVIRDVFLEP